MLPKVRSSVLETVNMPSAKRSASLRQWMQSSVMTVYHGAAVRFDHIEVYRASGVPLLLTVMRGQ
jgi:hypothetical protein